MSAQPLAIVSSEPLPTLGIASSEPLDQSWGDKAKSFLSDTLSKTSKALNVMNTLDAIEDVGDRLKSGDWSALRDIGKMLPKMELGNPEGPAPDQTKQLQDTYQKIKSGDYSGAAANVLPYVLANGEAITSGAKPPISNATSAVKDSINKSPIVAAAKTLVPSAADVAGKALKPVLEPATAAGKAVATAVNAYKKQAASNATDAAAAAQRESGRTSLADANPAPQPAPDPPEPEIDVAAAQQALLDRAAKRKQQAEPPAPNAVRQQAAQVRGKLADVPSQEPATSTVSPDAIAAAQQALRDKAATRKTATIQPAQATQPATPYIDPAILDSLAQQLGKPSFAKVTDPIARQKILDMGARFKPTAEVLAERARQEQAAKQTSVEPMEKFEQAADVLTNPQAGPISQRIDEALNHARSGLDAAVFAKTKLPIVETPQEQYKRTEVIDPSTIQTIDAAKVRSQIEADKGSPLAWSPEKAAALKGATQFSGYPVLTDLGNGKFDVVDGAHRINEAANQGKMLDVAVQKPEIQNPVEAKPEYYKPTGRATNGREVPTPGDLIKSGHLEGDPLTGGPQSSSTLGHVAAENEKAFNVADYLFQNGIRKPEDFEKFPVDEAMMERARKHGAAVGNAVPQNPYRTVINDNSLRLTMAHLAKMITDEKLGLKPGDLAKKEAADDLTEILSRSLADQKAKKSQ